MIRKKVTTKQVSEITGLAESTIRGRKAGTHVLTRVQHGRTWRFYLDEVERFAEGKLKRGKVVDNNANRAYNPRP
jgi:phage terminase Nu1 subunit (DNA packaging protein)